MGKPKPIVLILVGIGLFGLHIFGIEPFQHKSVLAIYMSSFIRRLSLRH